MSNSKGYIYILTNPSFKEWVKIGYASDVDRRLKELNSSECTPFAFRVYATYEVDSNLSDKKVHLIIDKLAPNLRSIDELNGQKRVREFYAMSKEDAYSILEAIAEIHNCTDKLKRYEPTEIERKEEMVAEEIKSVQSERLAPFRFSMCNIEIGEEIEFVCRGNEYSGEMCVVVDNKHVEYQGNIYTLSSLAKLLLNSKWSVAGPVYFKYKGEWLNDIRDRLNCK